MPGTGHLSRSKDPATGVGAGRSARTREELAALKPVGAGDGYFAAAIEELDEVVKETVAAAGSILSGTEDLQSVVDRLRGHGVAGDGNGLDHTLETLERIGTEVLMACSFQDLTGQRIAKVVNTLRHIEQRFDSLLAIWEVTDGTGAAGLLATMSDDGRVDRDLLHGPQLEGDGMSQSDIDNLFK